MSKYTKKQQVKDELNINTANYEKIIYNSKSPLQNESLEFEFRYLIFTLGVMMSTFINIYKDNLFNYNIKLLILLVFYFSRRLFIRLWYFFRLSEFFANPVITVVFYIIFALLTLDILYLLFSLFINNSLFHISALFMISSIQIPTLRVFPEKDKRYDGAPQELIHNVKKILYLSSELIYYCICIPMLFSQKNNVYINTQALITYSLLVFIHSVFLLFTFTYYKNSCDYYIHAKMMGCWKRFTPDEETLHLSTDWTLGIYDKDAVVKYKGSYYIALEEKNAGEPNDYIGKVMYKLFISPKEFFFRLLMIQGVMTIVTIFFICLSNINIFCLVIGLVSWHNFYYIYNLNMKIKLLFYEK